MPAQAKRLPPPRDLAELVARAEGLTGKTLGTIARELGGAAPALGPSGALHVKGKVGDLLERALGADAGSASAPDFTGLGVELKTVPVAADGAPRESTFVCAISLVDADRAEWATSRARAKLAHVLWVPVVTDDGPLGARVVAAPRFWKPTPAQERGLRDDFEEVMGLIGYGGVEALTAHVGRWMQVRPKAATGRVRTAAFARDGERIATVPRGLYLRPSFTGAILRDPAATP